MRKKIQINLLCVLEQLFLKMENGLGNSYQFLYPGGPSGLLMFCLPSGERLPDVLSTHRALGTAGDTQTLWLGERGGT